MHKFSLVSACCLAALAVILGAFGAHGLEGKISEARQLVYETAVRYQFYHAFALLSIGILGQTMPSRWIAIAGRLFLAGTICFSGSLYLLACRDWLGLNSWQWLGPITPIGGLLFIAGWSTLGLFLLKNKKK